MAKNTRGTGSKADGKYSPVSKSDLSSMEVGAAKRRSSAEISMSGGGFMQPASSDKQRPQEMSYSRQISNSIGYIRKQQKK